MCGNGWCPNVIRVQRERAKLIEWAQPKLVEYANAGQASKFGRVVMYVERSLGHTKEADEFQAYVSELNGTLARNYDEARRNRKPRERKGAVYALAIPSRTAPDEVMATLWTERQALGAPLFDGGIWLGRDVFVTRDARPVSVTLVNGDSAALLKPDTTSRLLDAYLLAKRLAPGARFRCSDGHEAPFTLKLHAYGGPSHACPVPGCWRATPIEEVHRRWPHLFSDPEGRAA